MKEGDIWISGGVSQPANQGYIWIDTPCCSNTWSEPVDLFKHLSTIKETLNPSPQLTPGMKLLVNQTLLELMQGKLEILSASPAFKEKFSLAGATRIQCSLPRLILETID